MKYILLLALIFIGCESTNDPEINNQLLTPQIRKLYVTNDGITLPWGYADTLQVVIEIQRKIEDENYQLITLLTYSQYSDKYEFLDTSLTNGKIAYYRIRAKYGPRVSDFATYPPVVKHTLEIVDTNFASYPEFKVIKLANEKILLVGKIYSEDYNSSMVFDPISYVWNTPIYLPIYQSNFSLDLMNDGNVLLTGGNGTSGYSNKTFVYDVNTNLWQESVPMNYKHSSHSTILLQDANLFVVGGVYAGSTYSNKCEIFDIQINQWIETSSLNLARSHHSTTLLPDGRILIAGGYTRDGYNDLTSSSEIYDINENIWYNVASMKTPRIDHSTVLLPDNRVLVVGSDNPYVHTRECEVYDIQSNIWLSIPDMAYYYVSQAANLLNDGRVIVIGNTGSMNGEKFNSEIYYPDKNIWVQCNLMPDINNFRDCVLLSNNRLVIMGGQLENYMYIMNFN